MTAGSDRTNLEEVLREEGVLYYTVKGVSMLPLIRQNTDLVVIRRPVFPCRENDVVLFKRDNGQYVLHRVVRAADGLYDIRGDNTSGTERNIREDQILGVMTGLIRNGEEIDLDTAAYRRYIARTNALYPLRAGYLRLRALGGRVKRTLLKTAKTTDDTER